MTYRRGSSSRPRLLLDVSGVEWEVYDESRWSLELALDWEFLPQPTSPGLIFSSRVDRRRLWPCPDDWRDMTDLELLGVLERARSVHERG
jgi:hypothetical protein